MSRTTLFIACALALPATAAFAQAPVNTSAVSWSYFDVGVQGIAPDEDDLDDAFGAGIRGSGAINENWHVFLGYNRSQLEGERSFIGDGDLPGVVSIDDDFDRYNIGIGYNLPVAAATDLFARVAYERAGSADFTVAVGDLPVAPAKLESTDGYSVEVGVRSAFTPRFEGGVSARYIAYDDPEVRSNGRLIPTAGLIDDDSTASLVLYGQYKFGNGWGIIGEGEVGSAYSALFLGGRLSY